MRDFALALAAFAIAVQAALAQVQAQLPQQPAVPRAQPERDVLLMNIAPISNIATGAYPSLDQHPLPRLRHAGVVVTLNSDDPPMFGAWLDDVYEAARRVWGDSDDDLADLARAGVRASFADAAVKHDVLAGIDTWLAALPTGEPSRTRGGGLRG